MLPFTPIPGHPGNVGSNCLQGVQTMTDAPRLAPIDQLDKVITHAPLFGSVRSRTLKALLKEAVQRMSGLGEDAESRYQQALAALRETGRKAVDALGEEFAALSGDQYVNRWATVQLLTDLQDPGALDVLDKIIASPIPAERSADPHSSTAGREVVIRTTAVEAVARLAASGSVEARGALLKHTRHSVRSVKIAAALAYLEQAGTRGRKELLRRMLKSDHWILGIRRMHPRDLPPIEGHRFLPPKSPPEAASAPRPTPGGRGATAATSSTPPRARPEGKALPRPTDKRNQPGTPAKRPRGRKTKRG